MIKLLEHRYLDYTIEVRIHPMHSDRYGSSFTIRRGGAELPANKRPIVYKETHDVGMSCKTEEAANQDALERAHEWISAQESPT